MSNEIKVEILKQDHFGRGIAKVDGMLVFVNNALPGEVCLIEIISKKKNYMIAKVIKTIKSSKDRKIVECPYYYECGGCHIMHQVYQKQLAFKETKVKELLERFTNLNISLSKIEYGREFNYRNKVIFHSEGKKLGFYQEKTNKVIEIDSCLITNEKINQVYSKINNYIKNSDFSVDELMIKANSKNEIMISVTGNILVDFFDNINAEVIYLNDKLIKGKGYLVEDILGLKFNIYPESFFQVNYEIMKVMYQKVIDFYKDKNYKKVLDLYCGTGTMGMLISKYVNEVVGVEIEKSAVNSAVECSKINNISNISFKCGKVEEYIDEFKNIDSIIVDPPRSGLDSYTLNSILKLFPKTIVYISCDPATLARDLKILLEKYEIIEINPFDMFPNTYHVECMAILKLKEI